MMRSLYAGVSGLQNHQTRMDVVGNNISNVNTTGFKQGRVNFQDLISQNIGGAAAPNERVGGINPKQVGLGMSVASIDTLHTQGTMQTTGVLTDMAILGKGFFILKDGEQDFYSRAGAFDLDRDGVLVNRANGRRVQGWQAQTVEGVRLINVAADVEDLIVPIGGKDPAFATTDVYAKCNIDKRTPELPPNPTQQQIIESTWSYTTQIYDSFGDTHTLRVDYTRVAGQANTWIATVNVDPEAAIPTNTTTDVGAANNADNQYIVTFDNQGTLQQVTDAAGDILNAGELVVQVAFDVTEAGIDPATGALLRQTFNLNLGAVGSVEDATTQFAQPSTNKPYLQNGRTMGVLESFTIDNTGIITGVYSNGNRQMLGQVALATFTNPGGLEKSGESAFVVTNNSGQPDIGPAAMAGKGKILPGALEMSNVDLASSFTDMIVTQRGFQANSRTIQTSDQMLQELLTLKR